MTEPAPAAASLVALHSEAHRDGILSRFDRLRKRDLLCDITLIVEDVHFKAHKALLAASSDYFSLMFTAEDQISQSTYRLDGMAAGTFSAVLEFIYSSQASVEEEATEQLLVMARLLEVGDLVEALDELRVAPDVEVRAEEEEVEATAATDKPERPPNQPPKRKRGRPRKILQTPAPEVPAARGAGREKRLPDLPDLPAERQVIVDLTVDCEEAEAEECLVESQPKDSDDADYEPGPGGLSGRLSKRKIRPPLKYTGYKVGGVDAAERREPGKRGRKRKYPNTEARCEDCGKVFKNHLFLKIHERTHTGEKPFRCHVCGKGFTQKHTLLVHQRMHTGEKPFICTVCSKALSTKHSLLEHMNLHAEEKSFSCDKCGKTFSQKRQLKSHYRVHTGKSFPECALCHHKFMDTAQLKKHLRTHTGEKPFTCEICGKCFTAKSTLQTHIRIHRGEKPFTCGICSKSFSDPSAKRRHVASHSGKKPFTCSFCSLSFTRLDNLNTHAKTHNKERVPGTMEVAPSAESPSAGPEAEEEEQEVRNVLQLQQYQLPTSSQQEIQIQVVTGDNIDFVPGQQQEISIIATTAAAEGEAAGHQAHPRLTLLAPPPAHMALVAQGAVVDQSQTIGVLESQVASSGQPEQMHVITLSKEAMEHLQAHHGSPQPLVQHLQAHHGAPQPLVQHLQTHHGPVQHLQAHHGSPQPLVQHLQPQPLVQHLHTHHGPPQPLVHMSHRTVPQLQVMHQQHQPIQQLAVPRDPGPSLGHVGREQQQQHHGQGIHINSQSTQPISISHTSQQISGHHIQGQTFQIQAGNVSYLYTTSLPQGS